MRVFGNSIPNHTVPCEESATKADDAETAARVAIEQLAAAKKSGLTWEVWQMAYDEVYLLMQKSKGNANGAADAGTGAAMAKTGTGGCDQTKFLTRGNALQLLFFSNSYSTMMSSSLAACELGISCRLLFSGGSVHAW